jgi:hypothetical protein
MSITKRGIWWKPLDLQFSRDGFNYRRVVREGDVAIYEQRWPGSKNVCYQVVRIRRHNGKNIAGRWMEPSEIYPSSSEWGVHGFTLTDKGRAFAKLRELNGGTPMSRQLSSKGR